MADAARDIANQDLARLWTVEIQFLDDKWLAGLHGQCCTGLHVVPPNCLLFMSSLTAARYAIRRDIAKAHSAAIHKIQ